MSIENIRRIKEEAGLPRNKKIYSIPKKSAKKLKQEAEEKKGKKRSGCRKRTLVSGATQKNDGQMF